MIFSVLDFEPLLQILLSALLGGLIGLEREFQKREAGLRTFSLVALGSCLFTIIAIYLDHLGNYVDPARIIQAVAIGIGFLGSGIIIYNKLQVEGLTTAAALWAVSAIGIGVGLGLYYFTILTTILVIIILAGIGEIEKKFFPDK